MSGKYRTGWSAAIEISRILACKCRRRSVAVCLDHSNKSDIEHERDRAPCNRMALPMDLAAVCRQGNMAQTKGPDWQDWEAKQTHHSEKLAATQYRARNNQRNRGAGRVVCGRRSAFVAVAVVQYFQTPSARWPRRSPACGGGIASGYELG
jgi:hypothetical protein